MNVLQVVTMMSPDGAYGGPVRVAFNQARALRARGVAVRVAGAARGYDLDAGELDGVPVKLTRPAQLVPFLGFAGLSSPHLLWWMLRRRSAYDVVHVHLARDLVTLPAAMLAIVLRKRVVVQTHGMVVESRRSIAPILDVLLTRPVLRSAAAVFHLHDDERASLLRVEPNAELVHLPNGVPVDDQDAVGFSTARGDRVEVLYLARLHERKRPRLFVDAAAELLQEGVDADFRVVGPDGGDLARVLADIASLKSPAVSYEDALAPSETAERMRRSSFYVLPSIDEPFPMSVLEAMAVGLPVVITESCGLAEAIARTGSGIVVDESRGALIGAMRRLIEDPELRSRMGAAARRTALNSYSMAAIGRKLEGVYRAESAEP